MQAERENVSSGNRKGGRSQDQFRCKLIPDFKIYSFILSDYPLSTIYYPLVTTHANNNSITRSYRRANASMSMIRTLSFTL